MLTDGSLALANAKLLLHADSVFGCYERSLLTPGTAQATVAHSLGHTFSGRQMCAYSPGAWRLWHLLRTVVDTEHADWSREGPQAKQKAA